VFIIFNLSSVRIGLTLVAMILLCYMLSNHAMNCDMILSHASLLNMLNLVVQFVVIYTMDLIWKLQNILTAGNFYVCCTGKIYSST
jgi:hypothetical protein